MNRMKSNSRRKMDWFQLIIAMVLVSQSTCTISDDRIDAETRGFSEELSTVSAEINFVDMLDLEQDVLEIVDALRHSNPPYTIKKLFTIRKWDGIKDRSNLPDLKEYIKGKVELFHQMDLPIAFRLLGQAGKLLRVAYAGCNGFRCSQVVVSTLSKYQNLVRESSTLSSHFVNICIRSLRYHRYSHYYLTVKQAWETSMKQFKRTIALATRMKRESEKVVKETEAIRSLCTTATDQAIDQSNWAMDEKLNLKAKIRHYKEMKEKLDADEKMLKKQANDLSKLAMAMRKEEAKVVTMKELERRKSVLSLQCNRVTRDVFTRICRTVTSWWIFRKKSCRHVKGQISEVECRYKINRLLVQLKNERLRELSSRLKIFRDKRRKFEERKLAVQTQRKLLYEELMKTAQQLKRLKDLQRTKENILDFAVVSLDLAAKAMEIVQTQLQKMTDFWDNVIQNTKDLIDRASNELDIDIDDMFKEQLLESGFSWLSLAKVLRIAAIEMEKTAKTVDRAFITLPTTAEANGIINVEGPKIIKETIELSTKYHNLVTQTKARIEKIKRKQKSGAELFKEVS